MYFFYKGTSRGRPPSESRVDQACWGRNGFEDSSSFTFLCFLFAFWFFVLLSKSSCRVGVLGRSPSFDSSPVNAVSSVRRPRVFFYFRAPPGPQFWPNSGPPLFRHFHTYSSPRPPHGGDRESIVEMCVKITPTKYPLLPPRSPPTPPCQNYTEISIN